MADVPLDTSRVPAVEGAFPLYDGQWVNAERRGNRRRQRHQPHTEAKDHFHELEVEARLAHESLVRQGAPCRISIYREGDRVFVDVAVLNESGDVISSTRQEITHQDFRRCTARVVEEEGMLLDRRI